LSRFHSERTSQLPIEPRAVFSMPIAAEMDLSPVVAAFAPEPVVAAFAHSPVVAAFAP